MLRNDFITKGLASFLIGGQWGSEAKGAAAAWMAEQFDEQRTWPDFVTTNAGAQAGHTHYFDGVKHVLFHLPTSAVYARQSRPTAALSNRPTPHIYLNAGSVLDPGVLMDEITRYRLTPADLSIHPRAAIIMPENREQSQKADSASRKHAGVGKGVGSSIAGKVMRTQMVAGEFTLFKDFVRKLDLNDLMSVGHSVLVEIPQGLSLSLNHSPFYPFTTSRDCTIMQAMSDAGIHPRYYGKSMMVLRTFPIRVGNTAEGHSGGSYGDQKETSWEELGQTPEITTVSKRIRRVFTFSPLQAEESIGLTHPDAIMITFCNYMLNNMHRLHHLVHNISKTVPYAQIFTQWGPLNKNVTLFSQSTGLRKAVGPGGVASA